MASRKAGAHSRFNPRPRSVSDPWRTRRPVSPGFTKTNLNGYAGTETVEAAAREVVRVTLSGPDSPTGTFTRWENETIPW
jgi:hypothetical protein